MKRMITLAMTLAAGFGLAAPVPSHYDGGRTVPVHRLALNDEFGDTIMPGTPNALPVSTKQTCGQCHDYETIAQGWHFNMSTAKEIGRQGQPWFLIDRVSGSQVPMSLRNWPGLYKPSQLGMSNWEWVYSFGRNLPGGDIADPADSSAPDGTNSHWNVTGPVEINCFACHSTDKAYDYSEWVRLMYRRNFRWAATGALGLGDVLGMGSRVPDYWGVLRGLNPDDSIFAVPPHVAYDTQKFDSKDRAVLELGKPRTQNCLACHSTTQVGMDREDVEGDVHLRAGLTCADCHANGLGHAIARGCEGDPTGKMDKARATASCVGCHIGTAGSQVGKFGAPRPVHTGIPLSHFEKLACTTCHSGVTENGDLAEVRTSRANRMGIYGRARWVTPQPFILEPVFCRNAQGKIEPRRMVWPAFWGTRDAKDATRINPMRPADILADAEALLAVRENTGAVLAMLATDPNVPGKPVIVSKGQAYSVNVDGLLVPECAAAGVADGYFYKGATNFTAVISAFDPNADESKFNAQQAAAFTANAATLKNLLQTLDAAEAIADGRAGAVAMNNKVYYRDPIKDTVIATNAAALPSKPVAFGWFKGGSFTEALDAYTLENAVALAGKDQSLTEGMVKAVLKRLTEKGVKSPLYVGQGQVWSLASDGSLSFKEEAASKPVSWALGHDVHGARVARGAKPVKCAACHTADSKFFFGKVTSTGPLMTAHHSVKQQVEYMGLCGSYHKLFGFTFLMRPFFKIFLWIVFAFVLLCAVAFTAVAVPALLKGNELYVKKHDLVITWIDRLAALGMVLGSLYLGVSGILGWLVFQGMTGYYLVCHMLAGGLFTGCLVALIVLRAGKRFRDESRSILWMWMLVLAVLVVFTATAPMMTWFGSGWQLVFLKAHRCVTVCFLAMAAWMALTGGRKE